MGGLSMNPEFDGDARPRLALQIAEKEEWGGSPGNLPNDVAESSQIKSPKKKLKLGSFELDTSYAKSVPGFMRLVQMGAMLFAFIFLLIPVWPDQGTYAFFCVFLCFGVLISGYLFFTLIASLREDVCCGISWIMLELGYFISFGVIIFLGSCLAANRSNDALLTIAAVLGFVAVITYIYCIWTTWKLRKELLKKAKELEEKENDGEDDKVDQDKENDDRKPSPIPENKNSLALEQEIKRFSKKGKNNSLPTKLKEEVYENHLEIAKHQRKRFDSDSDKDSAYSEGAITPTKRKVHRHKMRRSASAFDMDREFDHVLQKQPLTHLSRRPYDVRAEHGSRRHGNTFQHRRSRYGYPQKLAIDSFADTKVDRDRSSFLEDDLRHSLKRKKSMPDWLRAALSTEVETNANMIDDESEVALPSFRKNSTFPTVSPKQFPLLSHSDEESINYPSVSQNGPGRQFYSMPFKRGEIMDGIEVAGRRKQRNHHGKRKAGHHHQNHGRRPHLNYHHPHHHHHHRRRLNPHHRHHGHRRSGGRRTINDVQDEYFRRMVENDRFVSKEGPSRKSIDKGKKMATPEHLASDQFFNDSHWDDKTTQNNPIMEKYLADTEKMRL